ncbi:MAG: hypothetical protein WAU68_02265 [Vitreimonas sp.]
MRSVLLAVTLAGLPALAGAQTNGAATTTPPATHSTTHPRTAHPTAHPVTIAPPTDAQASGAETLAGESSSPPPASTDLAPAPGPTDTPAAVAPQAMASETAPAGVAAPGITLNDAGAAQPSAAQPSASASVAAASPATHNTARTQAPAPPSGVAAPGINANANASPATPTRAAIEPMNDLERAFVNAAHQASARAAFRHTFLTSQVALATMSAAANAPAREIRLGPGGDACLIFTSDARATQIMGPNSPRQLMTGREALQRIRGAHLVIININMDPYLTLDGAGIEAFLGAETAPAAPAAGPSQ